MAVKLSSWTPFVVIVCCLVTLVSLIYLLGFKNTESRVTRFGVNRGDLKAEGGGPSEVSEYNGRESRAMSGDVVESEDAEICGGLPWECDLRLLKDVFPVHYDIFLHPDIPNGVFNGQVDITLDINSSVDHLRLHVKNLEITNVSLSVTEGGQVIEIQNVFVYEPNEFLVLQLGSALEPERYQLKVNFNGSLTRGIVGLYRSEFFDPFANHTRYVVASKFQPTYARRAFPCFDEPGFKSTFTVSLVKPSELTALSNMPVSTEEEDNPLKGFTTVHFEKSVPMVTYLVAVAIGDFDSLSAKSKRGVPVRIFSTRFQVEKTRYALSVVPGMVDFYEKYFDIEYPLPKLDIIGIPDFVSGAMEHWGLISFRESNLLYHPAISSVANKQRVASVLAHELAHMWFGNLMTLKWWTDLWLNEGFASYCEYKAVNHVHPDWEIEAQFVSQDLTPVLVLDAKQSSHPILQEVSNPDQITEIFDSISYNKGASVIRMLEYFIGSKNFQNGVSKFLKAFSFKNAETKDLWEKLQAEVGSEVNVTFLMDTWTRQMGYPVLTTVNTDGHVTIRQQRYLTNSDLPLTLSSDQSPFGYQWEIPILLQPDLTTVLKHHSEKFVLPVSSSTNWTKLNPDYFGFFRVQYPDDVWREIKTVYLKSFTPAERCGLIDDIFSFAYSRHLTYDLALEFSEVLREDGHLVPWDCADNHFRKISSLLENGLPETYSSFRKYITNITSGLYKRFTWYEATTETHLDGLLKIKVFALACAHGHEECLKNANRLFSDWVKNGVVVPSGIRPVVYKWGMWQADAEAWEVVWNRYLKETDAQERVRLLSALASSQDGEVLKKFISLAGNESLVRRQDFFTAMNAVARNPNGNLIAWDFFRTEYENLVKRFSVNDRYFGRMILDITSVYSSQLQLQQVKDLFKKYPDAGAGQRARQTALETIQTNIEWRRRNVPIIDSWLKSNGF